MRGMVCGAFAALLFAAPVARAQVTSSLSTDSNWSATQGRTVGADRNVVTAEAGWPGIAAQILHGIDPRTDVGLRAAFNYAFENTTNSLVGFDLQVPARRYLMRSDRFDIEGHVAPGLTFYGNNGSTLFGIGGPVGLTAAYTLDRQLTVSAGVDVPILLSFANPAEFLFGPLIGGGGEYKIDKDLALTGKARFGPEFAFGGGTSGSAFAFQLLVGVAYALR